MASEVNDGYSVAQADNRRVRSIDVKEKYIKPTSVFELEDGVGIYRNRRR